MQACEIGERVAEAELKVRIVRVRRSKLLFGLQGLPIGILGLAASVHGLQNDAKVLIRRGELATIPKIFAIIGGETRKNSDGLAVRLMRELELAELFLNVADALLRLGNFDANARRIAFGLRESLVENEGSAQQV